MPLALAALTAFSNAEDHITEMSAQLAREGAPLPLSPAALVRAVKAAWRNMPVSAAPLTLAYCVGTKICVTRAVPRLALGPKCTARTPPPRPSAVAPGAQRAAAAYLAAMATDAPPPPVTSAQYVAALAAFAGPMPAAMAHVASYVAGAAARRWLCRWDGGGAGSCGAEGARWVAGLCVSDLRRTCADEGDWLAGLPPDLPLPLLQAHAWWTPVFYLTCRLCLLERLGPNMDDTR
jgi:hypothetical protein